MILSECSGPFSGSLQSQNIYKVKFIYVSSAHTNGTKLQKYYSLSAFKQNSIHSVPWSDLGVINYQRWGIHCWLILYTG